MEDGRCTCLTSSVQNISALSLMTTLFTLLPYFPRIRNVKSVQESVRMLPLYYLLLYVGGLMSLVAHHDEMADT